MLTSSTWAPAATCSSTSRTTCDRSPAAQLLGEGLAPGRVDALADDAERLVRADRDGARPRAQDGVHGWSPLVAGGDAEVGAEARHRPVVAEVGQVQAAHARLRERVARLLDARARRRPRTGRARRAIADISPAGTEMPGTFSSMKRSAAAPRTRQIVGRIAARRGDAGVVERAAEGLQPLGPVADLQLQEAGAAEHLARRAAGALVERVRGRVLDRADHERRRRVDRRGPTGSGRDRGWRRRARAAARRGRTRAAPRARRRP